MWNSLVAAAVFAALIVASATPPSASELPAEEPLVIWPAQQPAPPTQNQPSDPREMLEGGMQMVLQALELMVRAIPQYAAPEVLENGDIIIRRIPTEPLPKKKSPDDKKSGEKQRQI